MELEEFKKAVSDFNNALSRVKNVDLSKDASVSVHDFNAQKKNYQVTSYRSSFSDLKLKAASLGVLTKFSSSNSGVVLEINRLVSEANSLFNSNNVAKLSSVVSRIASLALQLKGPKSSVSITPKKGITPIERRMSMEVTGMPTDIRADIEADLDELEKCFEAGCFRSAVILCGRLLETALHRKYYESTGVDLLEKAPGIGLGKIIAKLVEKNVKLDPGIAQQIHLINNVRVFSVHKKQEPFTPSRAQTQAIMLYTVDVLRKLF